MDKSYPYAKNGKIFQKANNNSLFCSIFMLERTFFSVVMFTVKGLVCLAQVCIGVDICGDVGISVWDDGFFLSFAVVGVCSLDF